MRTVLDFEKPIAELDANIEALKRITAEQGIDQSEEIASLERDRERLLKEIFRNLTPWDRTLLARHPQRPYTIDYIRAIFDDFVELHGDRQFGDDGAIVGGMAWLNDKPVMVIGHQKGRDLKERQRRNFGMAKPEGYRKAMRLMRLAEKFGRPLITFVDTPAADPGVESEGRGISESIARNLCVMSVLKVPIVSVVVGEGGSGGALGIAVADRVLMQEYAIYSVIPPEGCAAILWRDPKRAPEAAEVLKLTAHDALRFGVVDEVVGEPLGGAHRDPLTAAQMVKEALLKHLAALQKLSVSKLRESRYERYRNLGVWTTASP